MPVKYTVKLTKSKTLYNQVLVPFEVCQEIFAGGYNGFAVTEFEAASWLQKWSTPIEVPSYLL